MKYLYTNLLSLLFIILFNYSGFSQQYSFPENNGKDGLRIIQSKTDKIELEFSISEFQILNKQLNGIDLQEIVYGLNLVPGEEGAPELPFISKNILIPNGAEASLIVSDNKQEIISNIDVYPASKIPFDTEENVVVSKGEQYNINEVYPSENIKIQLTEVRGMQYVQLAIWPFQYNPVTKELIVNKNLNFEIQLEGGKGTYGEERFRSAYWDPIISDFTFNANDIPKVSYTKNVTSSKDLGCEYLIIVPDQEDFISWADTIRKFRSEQGIDTKVMTINEVGGNDISVLNGFFEDVYDNWDPVPAAVLLMADYGEGDQGITSITFTHPYEDFYITDNYYADVTGNVLPDFAFARLTARNYDELELMVHKFIEYETNPPVEESFYNKPITALGWQTERWFQVCSETIGGYMSNVLGKTPSRINAIYEGNPAVDPWSTASNTDMVMNYFGPSGLNYIPSTPSELGGWTGGTADDIVDAINEGCFILQHRDHGFYSGWGEPAFHTNHISQLTNVDKLTHVFSINCQTGQFDQGADCFAEKFLRHDNGGAVSVTAPTQVSYSFVNDALVWGIYDNMWPDFMPDYGGNLIPERDFRPAFGLASGKYFLSTTNWAGNSMKIITYRLFHHHGDAFGNIYTEVPIENEVLHESGITSDISNLEISAAEGSLIGLSVNGQLIASGIVEDVPLNLEFAQQEPGTQIKVVATKQNYFRNESYVLVVPAEGPYIMKTDYTLNDANGNGEVDYNEEVSISVRIKNVGLEEANNVDLGLILNDDFTTITSGSYSVGNLAPGEEMLIEDAFTFQTSVDIPDMHLLDFIFSATDGNLVWESNLSLKAYAPNLQHSIIHFEEINGDGNAYLDPGETAMAIFTNTNFGHRNFPAGESIISTSSDFISISSSPQNFEEIGINESFNVEFEITASESTPYASIVSIINQINAAPFSIENEIFFTVGLIVEDWESETTNQFAWQFAGEQDWHLSEDYVAEGDFSLKSGDIGDNESSVLSLDYSVLSNHQISFYMQVSCQEGKDYLNFYIDDELIASWTGLVLFDEFIFPVTEGDHNFRWEYIKDEEGQSGLDAAWLDYIILPPGNIMIGIEESQFSNNELIKIYPNPANTELNIKNINSSDINLDIYNTYGQLVYASSNQSIIDISNLNEGVYILRVTDKETKQIQVIEFIKM